LAAQIVLLCGLFSHLISSHQLQNNNKHKQVYLLAMTEMEEETPVDYSEEAGIETDEVVEDVKVDSPTTEMNESSSQDASHDQVKY
jgi:hypothetical protein